MTPFGQSRTSVVSAGVTIFWFISMVHVVPVFSIENKDPLERAENFHSHSNLTTIRESRPRDSNPVPLCVWDTPFGLGYTLVAGSTCQNPTVPGQVFNGFLGRVYNQQQAGTVAIYSYTFSARTGSRYTYYTTTMGAKAAGTANNIAYTYTGIAFYAFQGPTDGTQPIYEYLSTAYFNSSTAGAPFPYYTNTFTGPRVSPYPNSYVFDQVPFYTFPY